MKNKEFNNNLKRACAMLGGQSVLARKLNVSCPTVNQWVNGIRPVPIGRMTEIEIATNGAVSRKDLCVEWDRHWPELAEESRHEKAS